MVTTMPNTQIVLTPSSLFDVLTQIDELSGKSIELDESEDGKFLTIRIDNSSYRINCNEAESVVVNDDALTDIQSINYEGYEDSSANDDVLLDLAPVEGGIIKEIAKTLLVGGLVRLASNTLKK